MNPQENKDEFDDTTSDSDTDTTDINTIDINTIDDKTNTMTDNQTIKVAGIGNLDLKELEKQKDDVQRNNTKRFQGFVTEQMATAIFNKFKTDKNFNSLEDAFVMIAILLQLGGSNQSGLDQITFTYKGVTASARDLQATLTKVGRKTTARQLARTYANQIYEISILYGIKGDLAKKHIEQVGTQTYDQAVWASNFQTHNPNCPAEVRKWLVDNYHSRFERPERY